MFMTHAAPPNGLDPGDRMPGVTSSVFDEMDGLMSDWSWRPRLRDLNPPVYVYSAEERAQWMRQVECDARATRNEACERLRLGGVCCPGAYDDPNRCLACDDDQGGYHTTMPAQQPWSFPAYVGPRPWTGRLGGTR